MFRGGGLPYPAYNCLLGDRRKRKHWVCESHARFSSVIAFGTKVFRGPQGTRAFVVRKGTHIVRLEFTVTFSTPPP